MISRYPHIGYIVSNSESQDVNGDFVDNKTRLEVKGRYEPNSQTNSLDYSAKFFCKLLSAEVFSLDEKNFEYEGKEFTIVQLYNYQTYCEIWLN